MAYLFLVLSSLLDGIKGCLSKPVSRVASTLGDSMAVNLCRTLLCAALGLIFCFATDGRPPVFSRATLLAGILGGISNALFMVSWLVALRAGAFMTLTVLGSASATLPVLLTAVLYGETILPRQLIGLAILILASWLSCSYQKGLKGKADVREILALSVMFVSCGLVNFSQKMFVHTEPGGSAASFNFFIYVFSVLFLLLLLPLGKKEGLSAPPKQLLQKTWLPVLIMSVTMYFVTFFHTLAAAGIPAGILYPTGNALTMMINLAYSGLILKEKPTVKSMAGILLTLAALVLINL